MIASFGHERDWWNNGLKKKKKKNFKIIGTRPLRRVSVAPESCLLSLVESIANRIRTNRCDSFQSRDRKLPLMAHFPFPWPASAERGYATRGTASPSSRASSPSIPLHPDHPSWRHLISSARLGFQFRFGRRSISAGSWVFHQSRQNLRKNLLKASLARITWKNPWK